MAEVQVRVVEARRFNLDENDRLVLSIPADMEDDAELIAGQVAQQFPRHPILVLCGGIELTVLRTEELDRG